MSFFIDFIETHTLDIPEEDNFDCIHEYVRNILKINKYTINGPENIYDGAVFKIERDTKEPYDDRIGLKNKLMEIISDSTTPHEDRRRVLVIMNKLDDKPLNKSLAYISKTFNIVPAMNLCYAFDLAVVSNYGNLLSCLNIQDDELCLAAVKNTSGALSCIKSYNQTEEIIDIAIKYSHRAFKFIANPSEKLILENCGRHYREFKNLPNDLILKVLNIQPAYITTIKNPTKEMCNIAIDKDINYIGYVKPEFRSKDDILKALSTSFSLCRGRYKITEEEILPCIEGAIKNNPECIKLVSDPSEELKLLAVSNDTLDKHEKSLETWSRYGGVRCNIPGCKTLYCDEEMQIRYTGLIRDRSFIFQIFRNPSEELKIAAVKANKYVYWKIKDPSEELTRIYDSIPHYPFKFGYYSSIKEKRIVKLKDNVEYPEESLNSVFKIIIK